MSYKTGRCDDKLDKSCYHRLCDFVSSAAVVGLRLDGSYVHLRLDDFSELPVCQDEWMKAGTQQQKSHFCLK